MISNILTPSALVDRHYYITYRGHSWPCISMRLYLYCQKRPRLRGRQACWFGSISPLVGPVLPPALYYSRAWAWKVLLNWLSERSITTLLRVSLRPLSYDHFPETSSRKLSLETMPILPKPRSGVLLRGLWEQKEKLMILAVLPSPLLRLQELLLAQKLATSPPSLEGTGLRILMTFLRASTSSLPQLSSSLLSAGIDEASLSRSSVVRLCQFLLRLILHLETDSHLPFFMISIRQLACSGDRSFSSPSLSELPSLISSSDMRSCPLFSQACFISSNKCLIFYDSKAEKIDVRSELIFADKFFRFFLFELLLYFLSFTLFLATIFQYRCLSAETSRSEYSLSASPTAFPISTHFYGVQGMSLRVLQSKKEPLEVYIVQERGTLSLLSRMARAVVTLKSLILKMHEQQRNIEVILPKSLGKILDSQQNLSMMGNSGPYTKVFFLVEWP